jgi:hypothetical protein
MFAEAAPGSTVRTARAHTAGGVIFGAQVRQTNMASATQEAVLRAARRLGIAVRLQTVAALTLVACEALPNPTTQPGAATGSVQLTASSASWPAEPIASPPTTCDELSQVQVIRAPIVSTRTLLLPPDTDTVVDASVWVFENP